jgi:hypothetical protein
MTLSTDIGPLDWRVSIVDKDGRPSPEFQRRWNTSRGNDKLIGTVLTGSGSPTGIPDEGALYVDYSTTPWNVYAGHNGVWQLIGVHKFTDLSDVPSSYTGSNNKLVEVNSTATGLVYSNLTLRLYGGFPGKPPASQTLFEIDMFGDETFPVNLTGSLLGFDVANTNLVTLPIKVNGSTVGNATISAGGSVTTYTLSSGYTAASKDKLAFIAPTPQDPTLAGLTYTWLGTRTNV